MKRLQLKKVMIFMLIAILILCSFNNFVSASMPMNEAYLFKVEDCTTKLDYYSKKQGQWIKVICYLTVYEKDGVRYPAYCLIADNDRSW